MIQLTANQRNAAKTLMANASSLATLRERFLLGGSPKHDFQFDFGYPTDLEFYQLYRLHKRNGFAKALPEKVVSEIWQTLPCLVEPGELHPRTPIEEAIAEKFDDIRFWQALKEVDRRSLVGEYAGVIFQLADGRLFSEPVEPMNIGVDGLVNIIPAWEGQLEVTQWDEDQTSPTYGEPVMMTYTESNVDPEQGKTRAFYVHRDRVVIWSRDRSTFDDSPLEACFNALLDMEKIRGAGGEGFWKNAKSQPVLEADPEVNLVQLAQMLDTTLEGLPDALDRVVSDWNRGFDQTLMLQGMTAKTLPVSMPDPKAAFDIALQEVAAAWNIPIKMLIGMQTGERASTEDADSWAKTNMHRRNLLVIPNIMDVVRRLRRFGVLPDIRWQISWADMLETTMSEKSQTAKTMSEVNRNMAPTGELVFTDDEIRDVMGYEAIDGNPDRIGQDA